MLTCLVFAAGVALGVWFAWAVFTERERTNARQRSAHLDYDEAMRTDPTSLIVPDTVPYAPWG